MVTLQSESAPVYDKSQYSGDSITAGPALQTVQTNCPDPLEELLQAQVLTRSAGGYTSEQAPVRGSIFIRLLTPPGGVCYTIFEILGD